MIEINDQIYSGLAKILIDSIGKQSYYNGSIEYCCDQLHSLFKATLIIYRQPDRPCIITDIVPVWWECRTEEMGQPAINDFCWREFKRFLIEN